MDAMPIIIFDGLGLMRDPLCKVLEDAGVPSEMDNFSPSTKVFSFPKKAPEGAVFASEQSGMEQLELWANTKNTGVNISPALLYTIGTLTSLRLVIGYIITLIQSLVLVFTV
jgi:hypothetical protein